MHSVSVCAVCSGTGSKPCSSDRWIRMPCSERNRLKVEEVWQEVEQLGCIQTKLHTAPSALNCHCSKHSYIRLCGQWCVVYKVNGTSTIIKLAYVRSQKRTQAEQEIRELSRVCHFLLLTCCAHAEHTTNVHHSITLVLDLTSKIPILCD